MPTLDFTTASRHAAWNLALRINQSQLQPPTSRLSLHPHSRAFYWPRRWQQSYDWPGRSFSVPRLRL